MNDLSSNRAGNLLSNDAEYPSFRIETDES